MKDRENNPVPYSKRFIVLTGIALIGVVSAFAISNMASSVSPEQNALMDAPKHVATKTLPSSPDRVVQNIQQPADTTKNKNNNPSPPVQATSKEDPKREITNKVVTASAPQKVLNQNDTQKVEVPDWYKKLAMFTSQKIPPGRKLCFVHIGKTAGSSIACYLGFRYECEGNVDIPKGRLPRYTTDVIHTTFNGCRDEKFNFYLFALRNPLTRIISWFQYEKVTKGQKNTFYKEKALLFVECYGTMNDLAEKGLGRRGKSKTLCQKRAKMAIEGTQGFSAHNKYNFGFYLRQTPPESKIVAIRTEHLTEDWNSVEAVLGGKRTLNGTFDRQNVSSKKEDPLSPLALANLCEALCEEFQVYKRILRRAENLTPEQVADSIAEVQKSCPLEPMKIRSCQRI